jgi:hypothetical protein
MCRPFKPKRRRMDSTMPTTIVPQAIQAPKRRSQHSRKERSQGCEIFAPLPTRKASPYLQIASVRAEERINPKENRYVLMIQPQGVRVCGGQYTADEVYEIARLTKKWDWTLNENNRPHCLPRLEALLDAIIKRSSQQGG